MREADEAQRRVIALLDAAAAAAGARDQDPFWRHGDERAQRWVQRAYVDARGIVEREVPGASEAAVGYLSRTSAQVRALRGRGPDRDDESWYDSAIDDACMIIGSARPERRPVTWKRLLRIARADRGETLAVTGERAEARGLDAGGFVEQPALLVWPDGRGRELAIVRVEPGEAIVVHLAGDVSADGLVTGLVYVPDGLVPDAPREVPAPITAAKQASPLDDAVPPSQSPSKVAIDGWIEALGKASLPHALGALLGLAVGDALGTTNEFKTLAAPRFPELATGPLDDVVGAGPFRLAPGEVTDDTQMAAALAYPFVMANRFATSHYAVQYLAWRGVAFDVGVQINQALDAIASGTEVELAGRKIWEARERFPAGNGSLMRTAVIGVMLAGLPEARRLASFADSAITHFDPRCQLACAAFNASIATALIDRASPTAMVRVAGDEVRAAAAVLRAIHPELRAEIDAAELALLDDLAAACDDDPVLYGDALNLQRSPGYVRVAFRLAYWELLHAADFAEAVIDVANRGGDADTNAAIAGALVGACHGLASIPVAWVQRVLTATGVTSGEWDFHPRTFLRALARGFAVEREAATLACLAPLVACGYPEYGTLPAPEGTLAVPALPLRHVQALPILVQLLERSRATPAVAFTPASVHVRTGARALEVASIDTTPDPDPTAAVASACAVYLYLVRRDAKLDVPATVPAPIAAAIRNAVGPDRSARPSIEVLLQLTHPRGNIATVPP